MLRVRGVGMVLLVAASALGCGTSPAGTSAAPPRPSPTPTAAPTATPAATPSPDPGPRRIDVVETGLGSYLDTTVPVAVLRSASLAETATGITVHLRVLDGAGATLAAADARITAVGPGATVEVASRVAGALRGRPVAATADVAGWSTAAASAALAATPQALACGSCGAGGSGSLTVSVAGAGAGGSIAVAAVCRTAAGGIIGGGQALHTGGAPPVMVAVPVILSSSADHCDASAQPAPF